MGQTTSTIRIAIVVFHGISPFHLSIPGVVFGEGLPHDNPFELRFCAAEPQPIRTSLGFQLSGLSHLRSLAQADIVIVSGWRDINESPPAPLLRALRTAHARGALIVGLCLGAYVLAAAGLLDGRRATTHWEYAAHMAATFPTTQVEADVLYIEDHGVLTSAGAAAGLDACLELIRNRLGATQANHVARRLVIPPHRDGGQAQFIDRPMPTSTDTHRLSQLLDSVRQRLAEPHTIASLASEAHMSRRTFTRHFKAMTGDTVLTWLLKERLHLAQQLLEQTDHPIEWIADLSGFGSVESFRLHFRGSFHTTPSSWRRAFKH